MSSGFCVEGRYKFNNINFKFVFKAVMIILSADQVKYVTKPLTHAENNVWKIKIVMDPNKLVTQ